MISSKLIAVVRHRRRGVSNLVVLHDMIPHSGVGGNLVSLGEDLRYRHGGFCPRRYRIGICQIDRRSLMNGIVVQGKMGIVGVNLRRLLNCVGSNREVRGDGDHYAGCRVVDVMGIRRNVLMLLLLMMIMMMMKLGIELLLLELLQLS